MKKILCLLLVVIMSFTLTSCGKSEMEKFREYLVEEAGYEEKNVDYFVQEKDGYRYTIDLNGSFKKEPLYNTDKFSFQKIYYNFENNSGSAEYLESSNRCDYSFALNKITYSSRNEFLCPSTTFLDEMFSLKELFDEYLKGAGVDRLDLFRTK